MSLRRSGGYALTRKIIVVPFLLGCLLSLAMAQSPLIIAESDEWKPYVQTLDIESGGVFDFSFLVDGPAGKYGPVRVTTDGHFEFADRPGIKVRFWGVNLAGWANFPDKAEADQLARRLRMSGYNTVRLHHFDAILAPKGNGPMKLNPDRLNRLDYLLFALKREGLYVSIDLYSQREFSDAEWASFGLSSAQKAGTNYVFKGLLPVSEAAFQVWARYASELLGHKNSYTGMTWAEDPALVGICPVNEDSPYARVDYAELRPLYNQAFQSWKKAGGESAGMLTESEESAFNEFVFEACIRSDTKIRDYLRLIGVRTPLTGSNHRTAQGLTFVRETYDYVDNHQYWDHPTFPQKKWQLPLAQTQGSGVSALAFCPRQIMPTRVLGKPFVVTEFNFVRPNQFRAEGGIIMPAYASLQDWDALYNFQYASSRETALRGGVESRFSLACDPIGLLADRISALLFLRRDIKPAPSTICYSVQPAEAFAKRDQPFPEAFGYLGLITRIASHTGKPSELLKDTSLAAVVGGNAGETASAKVFSGDDSSLAENLEKAGVLPPGSIEASENIYRSATGEVSLFGKSGSMKVVAPRAELFVIPSGQELKGDAVRVKNGENFATVSVIALDEEPINQSRRLLLVHLTDALPTGMQFASPSRRLVEAWGKAPHLVRQGQAEVALSLSKALTFEAWAVDSSGKRTQKVPIEKVGDSWVLKIDTLSEGEVRFAYEVIGG